MPNYHCELCDFTTHLKNNYTCHLSSKKHVRSEQLKTITDAIQSKVPESKVIETVSEFKCKYCDKGFSLKQSMNRHINICSKNKNEDLRKQVYLLKKQIDEQEKMLDKQREILDEQEKIFTKMIDELSEKIENIKESVVINDSFNNNIQNIYVTYHASDISRLTDKDEEYKICNQEIKV